MKMKRQTSKKIKLIVVLGFLIAGTALYYGCGENKLPPPGPSNSGTIIMTMEAI